jgi:pimeloyl-ACP methyl ester carboxylesterase
MMGAKSPPCPNAAIGGISAHKKMQPKARSAKLQGLQDQRLPHRLTSEPTLTPPRLSQAPSSSTLVCAALVASHQVDARFAIDCKFEWMRLTILLRRAGIALLTCVILALVAMLAEHMLERRDKARLTPGQTFAQVAGGKIRYLHLGAGQAGHTVVFLSGIGGTIEQSDHLQRSVARHVPTVSFDRGGYGFSENSRAHTALEQAHELAELLGTLGINAPVVLFAYSASARVARVFVDRFPHKTAGMMLLEPDMPEFEKTFPGAHATRRKYLRPVVHGLIKSSLGQLRLMQRLTNWNGQASMNEQRADAILISASHHRAIAREWFVAPQSDQQTLAAVLPKALPFEILFAKPDVVTDDRRAVMRAAEELAARSSNGRLVELERTEHFNLTKPGPVLDSMTDRIVRLARDEVR